MQLIRVLRLLGVGVLLSALVALGGRSTWSAENLQLRRCGKVTNVGIRVGTTLSDLSDQPAIVCSVDFVPSAANGYVELWDSPDDTVTHGQAVTVGDVGSATAQNGAFAYYGELGRLTQFGLEVRVVNGTAWVAWDD